MMFKLIKCFWQQFQVEPLLQLLSSNAFNHNMTTQFIESII